MSYADVAYFDAVGVPAQALVNITTPQKEAFLEAAFYHINERIQGRYPLPLTLWFADLKKIEVDIAVGFALETRGVNPTEPSNALALNRHEKAMARVNKIGEGSAKLDPRTLPGPRGGPDVSSAAVRTTYPRVSCHGSE